MRLRTEWRRLLRYGPGGGWWNEEWQRFIDANPDAGYDEIMAHAQYLMELFGLENLDWKRYPRP